MTRSKPMPESSISWRKSAWAALPSDVTSPIRSGRTGRGSRAFASRRPSERERGEDALSTGRQVAERERRIDRDHPELHLGLGRVQLDPASDPHPDAVLHAHRSAGAAQVEVDLLTVPVEQRDRERGGGRPTVVARLDQGEVHVAPRRAAEVADLALDPQVVGERLSDGQGGPLVDLAHRPGVRLAQGRRLAARSYRMSSASGLGADQRRVQVGVQPAAGQQLAWVPRSTSRALLEHEDLVGAR